MPNDELLLEINEWLDSLGIDRAYRKDMKESYQKDLPALKAQLAKVLSLIEEAKCEERERIMTKMNHRIEALSLVLECENPIDRMAVKNVINGWQALKQKHLGEE